MMLSASTFRKKCSLEVTRGHQRSKIAKKKSQQIKIFEQRSIYNLNL